MSPGLIVTLLALLLGTQPIATDLYLPALPGLAADLQSPMGRTQLTLSALLFAFGFSQLLLGPVADRFGRRPVLLGGLALYTLAGVCGAVAADIQALITPANLWAEEKRPFHPGHARGLAPAGRLDIDSTGLLVLTQDGRIAKLLIGENSLVEKEYLVRVAHAFADGVPESAMQLLRHGLELDGEALKPAKVSWANEDQLRVVLQQGKKRQIRRMCEAVGLQVLGLKRVRIGSVVLGKLPAGQWRYLRDDERF